MAMLYARQYILQNTANGYNEFYPGDPIPDPEQNPDAAGWVESGAAYWAEEPTASAKAVPMAAEPGVPGLAVGGEGAPDNLVGKVPKTIQRRRRK